MYRLEGHTLSRSVGYFCIASKLFTIIMCYFAIRKKLQKHAIRGVDIMRDGIQINTSSYTFS